MDEQTFRRVRWNTTPTLLGVTRPSPSITRKQWTTGRTLEALIISQNNPKRNGKYIRGGPFFVHKRSAIVAPTVIVRQEITSGIYKGLVNVETRLVPSVSAPWTQGNTPPTLPDWFLPAWQPYKDIMVPLGATGFARARPGNAMAAAVNTGIELKRDGLPSLPGQLLRRARKLSQAGSEYLNLAFGWLPLLRDVDAMLGAAQQQQRYIQQLIRDHGSLIRRRRSLGSEKTGSSTTVVKSHLGAFYPNMTTTFGGVPGSTSRIITEQWTITESWFEGGFRYHIPGYGIKDFSWIGRMRRRLFGLDMTPEILYNALPWSWLADWFTNYGDIVTNLSRNIVGYPVAEYAFVMRRVETVTQIRAIGTLPGGSAGGAVNKPYALESMYEIRTEEKGRIPATPFGFGVTYDGLNDNQKAILAALGISRARF